MSQYSDVLFDDVEFRKITASPMLMQHLTTVLLSSEDQTPKTLFEAAVLTVQAMPKLVSSNSYLLTPSAPSPLVNRGGHSVGMNQSAPKPSVTIPPGETLSTRLRRSASNAFIQKNADRPNSAAKRNVDMYRLSKLAEAKRVVPVGGGGPAAIVPPVCPTPPLDEVMRIQCEPVAGSNYLALPVSTDKLRLNLKALPTPSIYARPSRKQLSPKVVTHPSATVDYLNRPRYREGCNSLLRLSEATGVEFMCLVFNYFMEIIAVLDLSCGESRSLPGIEISPGFLVQRRKIMRTDAYRGNAIEVDFALLPSEVFAVVPVVVYDEGIAGEVGTTEITSELFARRDEDAAYEYLGWGQQECDGVPPHKAGTNTAAAGPRSEGAGARRAVRVFDETDVFASPLVDAEPPLQRKRQSLPVVEAQHQQQRVKDWARLTTNRFPVTQGALHVKKSFTPCVLFRHRSSGSAAAWGVKVGAAALSDGSSFSMEEVARQVVEHMTMVRALPLCSVHIEHCVNCEAHASFSRHVPGSYDRRLRELRRYLKRRLPPAVFHANHAACLQQQAPRVGSFEMAVLPYGADTPQLVYSKLSQGDFPLHRRVLRALAGLLMPEGVRLSDAKEITVRVLDSGSRRPLAGVMVELVRLTVGVLSAEDFGDELRAEDEEEAAGGEDGTPRLQQASEGAAPSEQKKDEGDRAEGERAEQRERNEGEDEPVHHPVVAQTKAAETSKMGGKASPERRHRRRSLASEDILRLSSPEAHELRHSTAFFRIRAWGKQDCVRWAEAFHFGDDVITNMVAAGVRDGQSLLRLVNYASLERWGARLKLDMEAALASLRELERGADGVHFAQTAGRKATQVGYAQPQFAGITKTSIAQCRVVAGHLSDSQGVFRAFIPEEGSYMVRVRPGASTRGLDNCCSPVMRIGPDSSSSIHAIVDASWRTGLIEVTISLDTNTHRTLQLARAALLCFRRLCDGHRIAWAVSFDGSTASVDDGGIQLNASRRLPAGVYFSEVDGRVFRVNDLGEQTSYYLECSSSRQVLRCHQRTLRRNVARVQALCRARPRRVFSPVEERALALIRKALFRTTLLRTVLLVARQRRFVVEVAGGKLVRFQARVRGSIQRRRSAGGFSEANLLLHVQATLRQRADAVRTLQRCLRGWYSRVFVSSVLRRERASRRIYHFLYKRTSARLDRARELLRVGGERRLLLLEERRMLSLLRFERDEQQQRKREEKDKVAKMLRRRETEQALELRRREAEAAKEGMRRSRAARRIQNGFRGWKARLMYEISLVAVGVLQHCFRTAIQRRRSAVMASTGAQFTLGPKRASLRDNILAKRASARGFLVEKPESARQESGISVVSALSEPTRTEQPQESPPVAEAHDDASPHLPDRELSRPPSPVKHEDVAESRSPGSPEAAGDGYAWGGSSRSGPAFVDAAPTHCRSPVALADDADDARDVYEECEGQAAPSSSAGEADEVAAATIQRALRSYRNSIISTAVPTDQTPAAEPQHPVPASSSSPEPAALVLVAQQSKKSVHSIARGGREEPLTVVPGPGPATPAQLGGCIVGVLNSASKAATVALSRAYRRLVSSPLLRELSEIKAARMHDPSGGAVSVADAQAEAAAAKDRTSRQKNGFVAASDALLQVGGFYSSPFDELDLQWRLECTAYVHTLRGGVEAETPVPGSASLPLSPATFHDAEMAALLTDLQRHSHVEVSLLLGVAAGDVPGPAFSCFARGRCELDRGRALGPQGGCVYLNLQISSDLRLLSFPVTRAALSGVALRVRVSLLPVACPGTVAMRRCRGVGLVPLPAELVDGPALEPAQTKWSAHSSAPVCVGQFQGRLLVACRQREGLAELLQFDASGWNQGRVDTAGIADNIVAVVAGAAHVLAALSSGKLVSFTLSKGGDGGTPEWEKTHVTIDAHTSAPFLGCASCYGGSDVFVFVDRENNLSVSVLERGACIRKRTFSSGLQKGKVTGICAYDNRLYVTSSAGALFAFDLRQILLNLGNSNSKLSTFLVIKEKVFEEGVVSIALCAGTAFVGLETDDYQGGKHMVPIKLTDTNKVLTAREGHLILVGGIADFRVRVLRTLSGGAREIGSLKGHTKSVSTILVDAAGRYIFSASASEILVWCALSFTCEKKIENLSITCAVLGPDCLAAVSEAWPFLQLWTVPGDKQEIALVRSSEWCHTVLKGRPRPQTSQSIAVFHGYKGRVDEHYRAVTERWSLYRGLTDTHAAASMKASGPDPMSADEDIDQFLERHDKFMDERTRMAGSAFVDDEEQLIPGAGDIMSDMSGEFGHSDTNQLFRHKARKRQPGQKSASHLSRFVRRLDDSDDSEED